MYVKRVVLLFIYIVANMKDMFFLRFACPFSWIYRYGISLYCSYIEKSLQERNPWKMMSALRRNSNAFFNDRYVICFPWYFVCIDSKIMTARGLSSKVFYETFETIYRCTSNFESLKIAKPYNMWLRSGLKTLSNLGYLHVKNECETNTIHI